MMYKKIINFIKGSVPDYDAVYQIVEMKEMDNDYMILYRPYGKSGVDKGLLSKIICDDSLLNNFSGATVRNLTACALNKFNSSVECIKSTNLDSNYVSNYKRASGSSIRDDVVENFTINELASNKNKLKKLSKNEVAHICYMAGYNEGYDDYRISHGVKK